MQGTHTVTEGGSEGLVGAVSGKLTDRAAVRSVWSDPAENLSAQLWGREGSWAWSEKD